MAAAPVIVLRRGAWHMDHPAGTGPGEITEDGCAVEFYALVPSFGEAEIVRSAVPEGASILELGCGTGRILRPLAELGHAVLGVDHSKAMLAHIPDLPTVCSPVQTLCLDRTFDAVLLTSTMINVEPELRRAFLATCRRHLDSDGIAVFEYNPPAWFETYERVPRDKVAPGGIRRVIRSVRWERPRMYVELEYHVGDSVWTQSTCCYKIGEEELAADLASAGLRFDQWLTEHHHWFSARPVS